MNYSKKISIVSSYSLSILNYISMNILTHQLFFQDLPQDDLYSILLELPYDDLMRVCSTDQRFRRVCNDDNFWIRKINHKIGDLSKLSPISELKPLRMTYRNFYKLLANEEKDFLAYYDFVSRIEPGAPYRYKYTISRIYNSEIFTGYVLRNPELRNKLKYFITRNHGNAIIIYQSHLGQSKYFLDIMALYQDVNPDIVEELYNLVRLFAYTGSQDGNKNLLEALLKYDLIKPTDQEIREMIDRGKRYNNYYYRILQKYGYA